MSDKTICGLLGIQYPVVQGGMAWVANASLAGAVSEAGGLGLIAAANAPVDYVRDQIRKTKAATNKTFGVNIMLMSPVADDIAQLVIDEGVKVVTTGAGMPGKYMKNWLAADIKVIPVVASTGVAKLMARSGACAVVAEGCEAGGHIGDLTTMTLVPQVCDAVDIPVIAAGGIADGRGMAAAFVLGAKGVQVGTRFLVAKECTIHQNFKDKVLKAKDIDTVVTGRKSGHPVRSLKNELVRELQRLDNDANATLEQMEEFAAGSLRLAAVEGDLVKGSFMAGQSAAMVKKEQTAAEIIQELCSHAKDILSESRGF